MESYFDFYKNSSVNSKYLNDILMAVMLTDNGAKYMTYNCYNENTFYEIKKNMMYPYNQELFLFIEKIYKNGYTISKNQYILERKSVQIIEKNYIKYLKRKNMLELSMDFDAFILQ